MRGTNRGASEMAAFTPVLLLLLLRLSESLRYEFVRTGARATLPCENFISGQVRCDGTTWLFSYNNRSVEVITLGASVPQLRARLRTTDDCSLQIQGVRPDDVGTYFCQQFDRSGTERPLVPDTAVTLSVISVTEQRNQDSLTLFCLVSTPLSSGSFSVTWSFPFQAVDQDDAQLKLFKLRNGLRVTVQQISPFYENMSLFNCEVSHRGNTHLFNVRSRISEEAYTPEPPSSAAPPTSMRGDDEELRRCRDHSEGLFVRNIVLTIFTSALLLILTVLLIWTHTQGFRAQRNRRSRTYEASVLYENIGEPSASVRIRAPPAAAEGSD